MESAHRTWQRAGYVAGVWVLLVLLPTASAVSDNPSVLFAHGVSPQAWIAALCVIAGLVFGASAAVFAILSRHLGPPWRDRAAFAVAITLTIVPFWGLTDRLLGSDHAVAPAVAAVALACAAKLAVRRIRGGIAVFASALAVLAVGSGFVLAPIALATASTAVAGARTDRPNVLWVILDEVSATAVSAADGTVRADLPSLRRLQGTATTYARTYSTYPYTDLAIPAMMSARSDLSQLDGDDVMGFGFAEGYLPAIAEEYEMLVPQPDYFCRSYACWTGDESTGTAALTLAADGAAVVANAALPTPLRSLFPSTEGRVRDFWSRDPHQSGADLPDLVARWQGAPDDQRPFFALVHSYTAHQPWTVDADGRAMMPRASGQFRAGSDGRSGDFGDCSRSGTACTEELVELQRTLYANAVRQADRELGTMLDALANRGLLDDALVVVTADHGTAIGLDDEHRRPSTADGTVDVARVPLLVKYPGQRVPEVVTDDRSSGQIMPTVLAQTGFTPAEPLPGLAEPAPAGATFTFQRPGVLIAGSTPIAELSERTDTREPPTFEDPAVPGDGPLDPSLWVAVDADVTVTSAESPTAALTVVTDNPLCREGAGTSALIADGSRPVGSLAWESDLSDRGQLRGWALAPLTSVHRITIYCARMP